MIKALWPQLIRHVSFLSGIWCAHVAHGGEEAVPFQMVPRRVRAAWVDGPYPLWKLIFRRIAKVAKSVVWSCDLVQTKHEFYRCLGHVKLIPGVPFFTFRMTQKHTDVCLPASGPHGGWKADLTSIHISQFHCTGTNYFRNMHDFTF